MRRTAEVVLVQLRRAVLGAASGALAGLGAFVFLEGLDRVTRFRIAHPPIIWFLPLVGLVLGLVYHYGAGEARRGNALLLEQIHEPSGWVPRRMAPLIVLGTWTTHLFGGSAGREGTALQMSASLTDSMSRLLRLDDPERRLMVQAALASGFGAVFGVPVAGAVFALEVPRLGRMRFEALLPAMVGSIVGDRVVRGLGYHHARYLELRPHIDGVVVAKIVVAGFAFGATAWAFSSLAHAIQRSLTRVAWPPLRPAIGGVAIVVLVPLVGRDYLGLSTPLAAHALAGLHTAPWVFALKLLFTAITLGAAFPGGEVTPLFVMGATLGSTLSGSLHADPRLLAAVGFVAVFAGASNTPITCTILALELFGGAGASVFFVGCVVSYVCSGHAGIYATQRVDVTKYGSVLESDVALRDLHHDE